jgi:hypothetical protein
MESEESIGEILEHNGRKSYQKVMANKPKLLLVEGKTAITERIAPFLSRSGLVLSAYACRPAIRDSWKICHR